MNKHEALNQLHKELSTVSLHFRQFMRSIALARAPLPNSSTAQTVATQNTRALRFCKPSISYEICTVLHAFHPVFCFDPRPRPKTGDSFSKLLPSVQPLLCPETAEWVYITEKLPSSLLASPKGGWFPTSSWCSKLLTS